MVTISPSLLEFQGPLTQGSTEYIQVTNDSDQQIAFKVKTTAPKLYCVRPNSHHVQPGESIDVSVIFLGLKEDPGPDYKCNDKFLIVTLPCPYDLKDKSAADIWPDLEAEFKAQSVSRKIKVAFVQTAPEPEPELKISPSEDQEIVELELEQDPEQETVYPKTVNTSINSSIINNNNIPTKIILDTSKANIIERISVAEEFPSEDKHRIEMLEEKFDSNAVAKQSESKVAPKQPADTPRPMTTTTVILFAFLAFIIGWLFF